MTVGEGKKAMLYYLSSPDLNPDRFLGKRGKERFLHNFRLAADFLAWLGGGRPLEVLPGSNFLGIPGTRQRKIDFFFAKVG